MAVSYLLQILKKIFFWSYGRSTWQYDILCALILAFIFLTPARWFQTGELRAGPTHQTPSARAYLLVGPDFNPEKADRAELERRVRVATGRADAQITKWEPRHDEHGKIVALEVDIR